MDIDLLKSTPDDHIEMMLMMHMDKSASDLAAGGGGGPYLDSPFISFAAAGGGGGSGGHNPHLFDSQGGGHHLATNPPQPSISFSNNGGIIPSMIPSNANSYHSLSSSNTSPSTSSQQKQTSMAAMREMIFRIAAMQPIYIDPESVKPPKRRNVRISKDPQSVAARHRRERISERIRILQRLVPGGTKMDTASMLDEAIHYVKFLKSQVQSLERAALNNNNHNRTPQLAMAAGYFPMATGNKPTYSSVVGSPHQQPILSHHHHHMAPPPPPQNVQQFSDC